MEPAAYESKSLNNSINDDDLVPSDKCLEKDVTE